MQKHTVTTTRKREIIDITDIATKYIDVQGKNDGVVHLFVAHTTAALTTLELDPGTDEDFLIFLEKITPNLKYQHEHNPKHAPDHILASIIGSTVSIPFANGKLLLGTWQRVVIVELDGPRDRNIILSIS